MVMLITPGQLYLHAPLNEYLIVVKNERGYIAYSTEHNTTGKAWIETFINEYKPVDPEDLTEQERNLLSSKAGGLKPKIGWYQTDEDYDEGDDDG